jgi:hypothetical protein
MSWVRVSTSTDTCSDIQDFMRPKVQYVKCRVCAGNVEVWSDEVEGVCIDCGATWTKPDNIASCLNYCEYADHGRKIITHRS